MVGAELNRWSADSRIPADRSAGTNKRKQTVQDLCVGGWGCRSDRRWPLVQRLTPGKASNTSSSSCLLWPRASRTRLKCGCSLYLRAAGTAETIRGALICTEGESKREVSGELGDSCIHVLVGDGLSVCQSRYFCLFSATLLAATALLMSSLGACCHWLKRTWVRARVCMGVCVCVRVTVRNWSSCRESVSALSELAESALLFHIPPQRRDFAGFYGQTSAFSDTFGKSTGRLSVIR